jgi:hypothetical protein
MDQIDLFVKEKKSCVQITDIVKRGRCPMDYMPVEVRYHRWMHEDGHVFFDSVEVYGGAIHGDCMKKAILIRRDPASRD